MDHVVYLDAKAGELSKHINGEKDHDPSRSRRT